MFILMHCGGMPFNGETLQKQSLGGSETAAYYIAKELASRGHKVILFTNSPQEGKWDGVKYCYAGQPVEGAPLGERFHFFAANTPHDVCIVQRHPHAFLQPFASKINLFWAHDLATADYISSMNSQLWNINRILLVSNWHIDQYHEVYGIPKDRMAVVRNGIDSDAYALNESKKFGYIKKNNKIKMFYSSRPERGLEHLVREGGIMERLEKEAPEKYHLYVTMYENFPQHMQEYYGYLHERCEALPNVTNLGCLTKAQLAELQINCDLWCYPTEFEEVSCITAMEAVTAGVRILTSDVGAIKETLKQAKREAGLIPLKDGRANEDAFVVRLLSYKPKENNEPNLESYPWSVGADAIERTIGECFEESQSSDGAIARHLMRMSDIYTLQKFLETANEDDDIVAATKQEMNECYKFAFERDWKNHYEAYYQYEKDRGVDYGPEKLDGNNRFEAVALLLLRAGLPEGARILDYGCAHGHYTINLAKRFPKQHFVGMDIEQTNIDKAIKWAEDEKVENVEFVCGTINESPEGHEFFGTMEGFDFMIVAEVLEHLEDVSGTVDKLAEKLNANGDILLTTPFGPWEYLGAIEHYPWRAHVHHLERGDLHDMFGMHPEFQVQVATASPNDAAEALGSYVTTFKKPSEQSGQINYERKLKEVVPRQTISLCMIVKDGEESLFKSIKSVIAYCDEVVIGIDKTTTDHTHDIIKRIKELPNNSPIPIFKVYEIETPLVTGFDEARNKTIDAASGDWILWIDADEHIEGIGNLMKYLRANQYNGYAVDHVHLSVDPPGALRIDKPTRVFRNNKGIRFYGVVHEHPEIEVNKGVGNAVLIPDFKVSHVGYSTESVRMRRFYRNIDLMARDRETYPDRLIGKFLWVRDLSMMCKIEMERNGGIVTQNVMDKAKEAATIYEELIGIADERMLLDGLEYYSFVSGILGGIEMKLDLNTSKVPGRLNGAPPAYHGVFRDTCVGRKFVERIFDERIKGYESKYR